MPSVTVVVAAYGRSNLLPYVLERVQAQTISDWELIVVDDASPDDTSDVVRALADPRMRVVRLGQNFGEQSGPNNVGVGLASATRIAFLNQDDLWFADHLEHLLNLMRDTRAQLVYSTIAMAWPPSSPEGHERPEYLLRAWRPSYDPRFDCPASSWLLERSLHLELSGWTSARMIFEPTSQHFLFRAWRSGARIVPSGRLTVLAEGAANRPGSYRDRHEDWQRATVARMAVDAEGLRREILARATREEPDLRPAGPVDALKTRGRTAASLALARAGVSPLHRAYKRRFHSRGVFMDQIRGIRGLPPLTGRPQREDAAQ